MRKRFALRRQKVCTGPSEDVFYAILKEGGIIQVSFVQLDTGEVNLCTHDNSVRHTNFFEGMAYLLCDLYQRMYQCGEAVLTIIRHFLVTEKGPRRKGYQHHVEAQC